MRSTKQAKNDGKGYPRHIRFFSIPWNSSAFCLFVQPESVVIGTKFGGHHFVRSVLRVFSPCFNKNPNSNNLAGRHFVSSGTNPQKRPDKMYFGILSKPIISYLESQKPPILQVTKKALCYVYNLILMQKHQRNVVGQHLCSQSRNL